MSKKWIITISVIVVLVAARIALPSIVKNYVNKTLNNLEGYTGSVQDIDISLYRGAYAIKELVIVQTTDSIPVPFVEIPRIDLSVQWKALFDGSIVGEILMEKPILNFAVAGGSSAEKAKQDGSGADWTQTLKDLIPFTINHFEILNGKITFKDFSTKPEIDIFIDSLNVMATNLGNVKDKTLKLPSTLKAEGTSLGGGHLNIDAKLNVLKKIPDVDLDLQFENVNVVALNDLIRAYAKVDAEKGNFNLYTEIAIDNGEITGYVKPVIEDLQIIDWSDKEDSFIKKAWETIVGGVVEIFKNQPKDQLATKVPLTGNLNNLEAGVWPSVWNIFKNAFIEALSKEVEGTIEIGTDVKEEE